LTTINNEQKRTIEPVFEHKMNVGEHQWTSRTNSVPWHFSFLVGTPPEVPGEDGGGQAKEEDPVGQAPEDGGTDGIAWSVIIPSGSSVGRSR
jgi:hypothetical protein